MPSTRRMLPPVPRHSYAKQRRWAQMEFPQFTKKQHASRADLLGLASIMLENTAKRITRSEDARLGAKHPYDTETLGPLISGGFHAKYSQKAKDALRAINRKQNELSDIAFAHYAASGIRESTAVKLWREARGEGKQRPAVMVVTVRSKPITQQALDRGRK